jgi:thioredoxin 1
MVQSLTKDEFIHTVYDFEAGGAWKFQGDAPAIIEFWAEWCGPCKMISPVLEELAERYKGRLNVYKVNADEEPDIAAAFQALSLPTLVFIPLDEPPQTIVGARPKARIEKLMKDVLKID